MSSTTMIDYTKPVQTKEGQPVQIITTEGRGSYPTLGYIGSDSHLYRWDKNGRYYNREEDHFCDLINAPAWKLPDPPEGQRWHKEHYWNEATLPTGYRPLLLGEKRQGGDEFHFGEKWLTVVESNSGEVIRNGPHIGYSPHRTKRPLPQPTPVLVPLGPEDVPPGSVIRFKLATAPDKWWQCQSSADGGVTVAGSSRTLVLIEWNRLRDEFEINHSLSLGKWDATAWEPCHKEFQP